jgi:SAM-dependent methyltransferase
MKAETGPQRNQGVIRNALGLSHQYLSAVVRAGDRVVDATAGNGSDTVFLARLAGEVGHVDAFDIQAAALARTREKLVQAGLENRCTLHLASHDQMAARVAPGVRAVMFNLGYLPGGDHRIGTSAATTLPALEQAMALIQPGGIITIGIYYGGDSGFAERDAVLEFLRRIDVHDFVVQKTEMANAVSCAPIFVCIERLR